MQSQDYQFSKPYSDLDLQTRKRDNGKRYITHDPDSGERIRRRDQITTKQFNRNPYGPPVLDPNIDFSSIFEMLGEPQPDALGGAMGSNKVTRGGTLANALFGGNPAVTRLGGG